MIPVSLRYIGDEGTFDNVDRGCWSGFVSLAVGCGVALLGVDHGEDTLGGLGS